MTFRIERFFRPVKVDFPKRVASLSWLNLGEFGSNTFPYMLAIRDVTLQTGHLVVSKKTLAIVVGSTRRSYYTNRIILIFIHLHFDISI